MHAESPKNGLEKHLPVSSKLPSYICENSKRNKELSLILAQ